MATNTDICVARSPAGRIAVSYTRVTALAAHRTLLHTHLSTTSRSVTNLTLACLGSYRVYALHRLRDRVNSYGKMDKWKSAA